MKQLKEEEQDAINGGSEAMSGPIISALTTIIKCLQDAGYALGSGIRRISENNLCPLE